MAQTPDGGPATDIKAMRITLRPHDFGDGGLMELRIAVDVGSLTHVYTQAVTEDDMTSRFDYYFNAARESLRDALLRARAAQSPAETMKQHIDEAFGK